jgi:hypothetical protein
MNVERDVLEVALEAGKRVWVHAQGRPSVMLAAAIVVAATAIGYGSCKYGRKYGTQLIERLGWI